MGHRTRTILLCMAAALPAAAGCASSRAIRADIREGRADGSAVDVPFVRQRPRACGAAALASVLRHLGQAADEKAIAEAVQPDPQRGAVTFELALYARSRGALAVQRYDVPGHALEAALEEGVVPIVLLADGANALLGRYHYAVLTGRDRDRGLWLAHDGLRADAVIDDRTLEARRRRGDRWALFVVDPRDRPEGLGADVHLELGLLAERMGDAGSARHHYRQAAWNPHSAQALLNHANIEMRDGDLERAEMLLRMALAARPEFPAAQNNLAWVLLRRKTDLAEAERLARAASQDPATRTEALDTLEAIVRSRGDAARADAPQ